MPRSGGGGDFMAAREGGTSRSIWEGGEEVYMLYLLNKLN